MSRRIDIRNRGKKVQKTIRLSLAGRNVVAVLLASNTDGTVDTARTIRELRRGLKLREAADAIQKLEEEAQHKADETKRPFTGLSWDALTDTEADSFTVDSGYLSWLQERLGKHDWGKVKDREGKEITVPVAPALLEAVADTVDAVAAALTAE